MLFSRSQPQYLKYDLIGIESSLPPTNIAMIEPHTIMHYYSKGLVAVGVCFNRPTQADHPCSGTRTKTSPRHTN